MPSILPWSALHMRKARADTHAVEPDRVFGRRFAHRVICVYQWCVYLGAASTADTYHMHYMHMQGGRVAGGMLGGVAAPLLAEDPGTRISNYARSRRCSTHILQDCVHRRVQEASDDRRKGLSSCFEQVSIS